MNRWINAGNGPLENDPGKPRSGQIETVDRLIPSIICDDYGWLMIISCNVLFRDYQGTEIFDVLRVSCTFRENCECVLWSERTRYLIDTRYIKARKRIGDFNVDINYDISKQNNLFLSFFSFFFIKLSLLRNETRRAQICLIRRSELMELLQIY